MNDELIDLFEKQAAYEGVDLESLNDEELAYVYNNFITNLAEQEGDEAYYGEDVDAEQEAYEKLAEAEILGRHMARAYMDELEKEAEAKKSFGQKVKDFTGVSDIQEGRKQKASAKEYADKAEEMREKIKAGVQSKKMKDAQGRIVAKRVKSSREAAEASGKAMRAGGKKLLRSGGIVAGTGLAAKGLHSMFKKEAQFDDLISHRMAEYIEFGKEAGYTGSALDDTALEMLHEAGYDLSPLFE